MFLFQPVLVCSVQIAQLDVTQSTAEKNVTVKILRNIVHRSLDYVSLVVIITGLEPDVKVVINISTLSVLYAKKYVLHFFFNLCSVFSQYRKKICMYMCYA